MILKQKMLNMGCCENKNLFLIHAKWQRKIEWNIKLTPSHSAILFPTFSNLLIERKCNLRD